MRAVKPDNWEQRMAERALARRADAEASGVVAEERRPQVAAAALVDIDEAVWHGWPRPDENGLSVLIGTGVHCAGCGRFHGITSVAFDEGWEPPGPEPDWPYPQDACPVCEVLGHGGPDPA